jgi:hypothetical protein
VIVLSLHCPGMPGTMSRKCIRTFLASCFFPFFTNEPGGSSLGAGWGFPIKLSESFRGRFGSLPEPVGKQRTAVSQQPPVVPADPDRRDRLPGNAGSPTRDLAVYHTKLHFIQVSLSPSPSHPALAQFCRTSEGNERRHCP